MSSHQKRWLTALVAVPLLVLVIGAAGRTFFVLLVGLVAAVALLEYYALVLPGDTLVTKVSGLVLGLTLLFSVSADVQVVPAVLVLVFFGSALICLTLFHPQAPVPEMLYRQVTGLIYIPLLLGHLILIRDWDHGVTWVFFLLAVIFAGDTAAYYTGKTFGHHKLSPNISPGKTVEGAVGGLVGNLLVGVPFKIYCFAEFGWGPWLALILVMGVLGQAGDLTESMLKRSAQFKDSGKIFPGHGGLLDRIDALIFAAPALYYFKTYLF
ncbi:MAG: phosphatidate cytidylyltransferase [Deltaproteobacteria bacterium]|nr:phosphatidate cytidylyltransferase [Deltaproteobacteria bacterium]MBW2260037.1 phosphatidate cytidylyltransferase [Deltaproteobacteria bacterium]